MANQPATITALNQHWITLSQSSALCRRLRVWRQEIPAITARTPDELVMAARTRPSGAHDCPVLTALVSLAHSDDLALHVVVQAMLPRWCAIIASTHRPGLSRDDLAALVVSIGTETILRCDVDAASTPTDYRLWSDTRRRVHRHLASHYPTVETPTDPTDLAAIAGPDMSAEGEETVADLVAWIRHRSDLSANTALLVAVTRTTTTTLQQVSDATGIAYNTLARRRARAERRLAVALA